MKQRPTQPIKPAIFALLLSWLLLAAGPIHAEVAAICSVGGIPSTHANFALALADSSCATINLDAVMTITGSHTITRNLEIKGRISLGGASGITFDGQNNGRIFTIGADNLTVTFDHLLFRNANTTGLSGTNSYGGAIRNIYANGTVTVKNSHFENNRSGVGGGAIYNSNALVVLNSEFSQNDAPSGGAIYSTSGSIEIDNSSFLSNSALNVGGALYFQNNDSVTIDQTTFDNNSATQAGAIYADIISGGVTVTKSVISQNEAGIGGGLVVWDSSLIMETTTLHNNSAPIGAGMFIGNVTAVIRTTTFSDNSASKQGGAISTQDSKVDVINSTISGSRGPLGSVYIYLTDTAEATDIVTLLHTTVVANDIMGIVADAATNDPVVAVRLQNSIVVHHQFYDCRAYKGARIDATLGYNLDSNGSCISSGGTGNVTVSDVGLIALANNGGSTQTHLLAPNSPARDQIPAGTNGCGTTTTSDQRGKVRPEHGLCDIGAVEASCADNGYTFPYDVGTVVSSDHALDLRRAIVCANENATADTINLTQDISLTTVDNATNGQNGLPAISSAITLQGNDFTLARDSSYSCGGSDPQFRLFHVAASGNLTLHDLTLANGCVYTADGSGQGGLISNAGTLAIYSSRLTNSYAETGGGAISNSGTLTLNQTTLDNNRSGANGGGLSNSSSGTISQSTLSNNQAVSGGGIYNNNNSGLLTVLNSTLSGNQAVNGAAIYNGSNDNLSLSYSTVANNTSINTAAVENRGSLTLASSLIADNSTDCFYTIAPTDSGYNLVEAVGGNSCGLSHGVNGNIVGVDPALAPLATIGGSTATHLLALNSAALDQIPLNSNGCGSTVTSDQPGGTRPGGVACDIGAVEVSCAGLGILFPYTMSSGSQAELNTALQCANSNATADTITLTSDVTLTQMSDSSLGNSGLVPITSEITLAGAGYTIGRDSSYSCDGSDPAFRHLLITASGNLTLSNLTLSNGCLLGSDATAYGGAIHNSGTLMLSQSQLTNSRAYVAGALWNGATGSATIEQSTISGNTAGSGGGIINSNNLLLRNSTVSNNTATSLQAGGIWNASGTLQLLYSTVAANTAPSRGGGVLNSNTLILQGALIADNNKDCENDATVTNNGDNFIEGTGGKACGIGNGSNGSIVGVDPQLGSLQDNGGATPTKALLAGSPAIDAVTGSGCPSVDQRGVARPQEGACDMGAYEAEAQVATTPTLTMSADGSYGWTPDQSGCTESLYRSETPYAGYAWLTDDPANYDGSGSLTSVETNYFYYLYVDCGSSTAQSDAVGEFTFAIVPGN